MGKSLGLGSVEVRSKLFIVDTKKGEHRYSKLFGDEGFYEGYEERDMDPFDTYRKTHLTMEKIKSMYKE